MDFLAEWSKTPSYLLVRGGLTDLMNDDSTPRTARRRAVFIIGGLSLVSGAYESGAVRGLHRGLGEYLGGLGAEMMPYSEGMRCYLQDKEATNSIPYTSRR